MNTEYKEKNTLPDLYNILGITIDVCKESNCKELIQKAYNKRVKYCHPDKRIKSAHNDKNGTKEFDEKKELEDKKELEAIFQLVTSAYNILINEKERIAYNHKLSLDRQCSSDYFKLKKGAEEYSKTLGEYLPASEQQKLTFKDQMKQLDNKHGYEPTVENSGAISCQDTKKRMFDLKKLREAQERECCPEKLFDGHVDPKKFNALFDKYHNRETDNPLTTYTGAPAAWNDMGSSTGFSDFDTYDNLYVNDSNRLDMSTQNLGSVDFGHGHGTGSESPIQKIRKKDLKKIKAASYFSDHNVLSDEYYESVKQKLRERKCFTEELDNMTFNDYQKDNFSTYGIFDQLGVTLDDTNTYGCDDNIITQKLDKLITNKTNKTSNSR